MTGMVAAMLLLCLAVGLTLGGRGLGVVVGLVNLPLGLNAWYAQATFSPDGIIDKAEEALVLFIGIGGIFAVVALIVYGGLAGARWLPRQRKMRTA